MFFLCVNTHTCGKGSENIVPAGKPRKMLETCCEAVAKINWQNLFETCSKSTNNTQPDCTNKTPPECANKILPTKTCEGFHIDWVGIPILYVCPFYTHQREVTFWLAWGKHIAPCRNLIKSHIWLGCGTLAWFIRLHRFDPQETMLGLDTFNAQLDGVSLGKQMLWNVVGADDVRASLLNILHKFHTIFI